MEMDPRENNKNNFQNGTRVKVTDPVWGQETRAGFVAKQLDERIFLVKLDRPFSSVNPGKSWLKVCRDYAHQCVEEV